MKPAAWFLGLWILLAPSVAAQTPPPDLKRTLADLVDLPTPEARRAQAGKLATQTGGTMDELLAAMASFGEFAAATPGVHEEHVPLRVGDKTENTELFVFVPQKYDIARPAPLMLAFHGTGGSGRGMHEMWRAAAEETGMLVLCPSEAGPNDGYHFSERERDSALAALRWIRRRYNIDENRIYASGISRGGHLAWDLALRFPDRFAAIAPFIGSPRITIAQGQNNMRLLENVATMPIRDLGGARDDPGLVFSVRLAFEKLAALGARDAKYTEFPELGHDFDFSAVDWPAFLRSATRNPRPDGVVSLSTVKEEARAFWVEALAFDKTVQSEFTPRVAMDEWNGLDESQQRRRLVQEAEQRTARVEAWVRSLGVFDVKSRGATKVRLLLTQPMFDPTKPVRVAFGEKVLERKLRPDRKVLLTDFAERFDRTFLPLAQVEVP